MVHMGSVGGGVMWRGDGEGVMDGCEGWYMGWWCKGMMVWMWGVMMYGCWCEGDGVDVIMEGVMVWSEGWWYEGVMVWRGDVRWWWAGGDVGDRVKGKGWLCEGVTECYAKEKARDGSLVPRPRPAFHHLQYTSDGKLGKGLGTTLTRWCVQAV